MFQENGPTIVRKRLSFFSIVAISLAAVLMTTIVSASGIVLYSLRVIDKKSDGLISLVGNIAEDLPEFRKVLPPALADAIDDQRMPGYLEHLRVSVRMAKDAGRRSRSYAVVEVENLGDRIVSLLSMRIVGLDKDGDPVAERSTFVATPLQIEGEWRGPLMPHSTRRFPIRCWNGQAATELTHEITDVRIWSGDGV